MRTFYTKTSIYKLMVLACVFLVIIASSSCLKTEDRPQIKIISYVVRDRVIPLDLVHMRSMIIVGFRIFPKIDNLSTLTVKGTLYNDNKLLSEDTIVKPDSAGNNFGFDIPLSEGPLSYDQPMSILDGKCRIVIKLFDEKKHLITQTERELERNQIGRTFYGFDRVYEQPKYILIKNQEDDRFAQDCEKTTAPLEDRFARGSLYSRIEANDKKTDGGSLRLRLEAKDQKSDHYTKTKITDYVIFQKSYLERVYPNTLPEAHELIKEISTEISRNESKSLTFSIRAMKDLRRVRISVSTLKDKQGRASNVDVQVGAVNQLTEVVREDDKKNIVYYQYAPKIIEDKEVSIPQNHTQTYWLTIKANSDTKPGNYYGTIKINPQSGKQIEIPCHVTVLPLELSDTDKQYGMMMDYVFYELDNDTWTEKEKNIIQKRGTEIYRDLKDHGMTVIYPHSYFYYKVHKSGEPILNSLRASLGSYKSLQFPGPFVWYLGHLVQTAKPKHPGSILNYDAEVAKKRLRDLLVRFEMMAKELKIPKDKLIVQLVDEPDPDQKERTKAGKELHKVAKALGFKTLITRSWSDVDVICTGTPDNEKQAQQRRNLAKEWWIYPNNALDSKNLAYTRYVFGFGAWRWGVNGVIPWTYQMSQGSNGNPFTVLDGPEIMVAYPGVNGPIPTPTWEAIRDGINDYKYIYLLEKLIAEQKSTGDTTALRIEQQLIRLKKNLGKSPGPQENDYGDWTPKSFEQKRKQITEWAMELQKKVRG